MKKIIIGQLMMWANLLAVIIGYHLYKYTGVQSEYLDGLIGSLSVVGACFNAAISILFQISGHNERKHFQNI